MKETPEQQVPMQLFGQLRQQNATQMLLEARQQIKVAPRKAFTPTLFRELPEQLVGQLPQELVLVRPIPWRSSHVMMLWLLLRAKRFTLRVAPTITPTRQRAVPQLPIGFFPLIRRW